MFLAVASKTPFSSGTPINEVTRPGTSNEENIRSYHPSDRYICKPEELPVVKTPNARRFILKTCPGVGCTDPEEREGKVRVVERAQSTGSSCPASTKAKRALSVTKTVSIR